MSDETREKAEKIVSAKERFYTTSTIFAGVTLVLLMVAFAIPSIVTWVLIPVPVFLMILGISYIQAFGPPFGRAPSENWREEEIQKEMAKLTRADKVKAPPTVEPSESMELELKELEQLKRGGEDEDYV